MDFKRLTSATSVVFMLIGLVFAFGPTWEVIRALGLPNFPSPPVKEWWLLASADPYFRLWALALFGIGLLLWSIRNLRDAKLQVNVTLVIFIICILACLPVIGSGWIISKPAAKIMLSVYLLFGIVYGRLLLNRGSYNQFPLDDTQGKMREQWAQQISAAAAQQERNRLARDLHDSIKQQLFSINVSAATAQTRWESDRNGAATALGDVRKSVREAMAEMEAMLHHLRPAPLETIGLVESLRRQCESLQYRTEAAVTIEIGDLPENGQLPPGAQEAVFRIAQEALANIARHARAANVQVRMYQQEDDENGALWLKIKDDGAGFDPTQIVEGMGLANIRNRASEVGGSVQIESQPNNGTAIVVRAPLLEADSDEVKRWLRIAAVLAAMGFFVGPFLANFIGRDGLYNRLLGIPLFGIAWMGYRRAHRASSNAHNAKAISQKSFLRLKRHFHTTRALLYAAIAWWLIEIAIFYLFFGRVREALFAPPLLLCFIAYPVYELYRLHKTLSEESSISSPLAFANSIQPLWRQAMIVSLGVFLFAGYYHGFLGRFYFLPTLFLVVIYAGCVSWWRLRASRNVLRGDFVDG